MVKRIFFQKLQPSVSQQRHHGPWVFQSIEIIREREAGKEFCQVQAAVQEPLANISLLHFFYSKFVLYSMFSQLQKKSLLLYQDLPPTLNNISNIIHYIKHETNCGCFPTEVHHQLAVRQRI